MFRITLLLLGLNISIAQAEPACTISLFGDSILYGAYDGWQRLEEPPAEILKRLRPKFEVQDFSWPGETAQMRQEVLDMPVKTKFVVFQHGINDADKGKDLETPLRAMLMKVRNENRRAIVTGLTRQESPLERRDDYDRTARRVALETGAAFANWGAVPLEPGGNRDGLHPSQEYAERLIRKLIKVLDKLAPECAPAKTKPIPRQSLPS